MTDPQRTVRPVAVWFLYSEADEPLGQLYRDSDWAVPMAGASLRDGTKWKSAQVVSFLELRSACEIRRFRVIIRVLA